MCSVINFFGGIKIKEKVDHRSTAGQAIKKKVLRPRAAFRDGPDAKKAIPQPRG
jgi:hypothetical protein